MSNIDRIKQGIIGKTCKDIYVSSDGEDLLLVFTDYSALVGSTDGDCCSQSWWADITGVKQILGREITNVEEIDMPDPDDNRSRQEIDIAYGYRFTTTHGVADFVFRNSSNGYYGGDCQWSLFDDDEAIGYGDYVRTITEDWSA